MLSQPKNITRNVSFILVALIVLAFVALLSGFSLVADGTGLSWSGFSTVDEGMSPSTYAHDWDDNPNAYLPEADVLRGSKAYSHAWDDNPFAYVPEAELLGSPDRYPHNWDDNPVATVPDEGLVSQPED